MQPAAIRTPKKKAWYKELWVQVLIAIIIGAVFGHIEPETGVDMKAFGDGFIKLIKMIVAPIIFCTVVMGIASMGSIQKVGRVGGKALLYFIIFSFLSLFIGMAVANVFKPGVGMNVDVAALDTTAVDGFAGAKKAQEEKSLSQFLLHIIPDTVVGAFATGEILQVLFFSILFGLAVAALGDRGKHILGIVESVSHVFFVIVGMIMVVAPIGAFGAMAYTVGAFGIESLIQLAELVFYMFASCIVFIFTLLALVLRYCGLSIFQYLSYIKDEIIVVFGTCSSETVFPRMIEKLTNMGCDRSVVGMVLPTGYSFNLDGTMMYLSMAAIFLAQATNTELTLRDELVLLGVMMISSKGAAGVYGTAFVVLTATLASLGTIPVTSVALVLGVDRFMAQARATTNLIGNGIATIFVAKWENKLDVELARKVLSGEIEPELESEYHA